MLKEYEKKESVLLPIWQLEEILKHKMTEQFGFNLPLPAAEYFHAFRKNYDDFGQNNYLQVILNERYLSEFMENTLIHKYLPYHTYPYGNHAVLGGGVGPCVLNPALVKNLLNEYFNFDIGTIFLSGDSVLIQAKLPTLETLTNEEKQKLVSEYVNTDMLLEYKGLLFDEWTVDEENGGIWGEMCYSCAEKYKDQLENELSSGGIGACSVQGCNEVGHDNEAPGHYYIDFVPAFVHFIKKEPARKPDIGAQIEKANVKRDLSAKSFNTVHKDYFTR